MRRALFLMTLWLLTGCASVPDDGSQRPLGTVTVQNGLVGAVSSETIPLQPGQPVPDGFLDEPVRYGRFHYRLEEGECTGTGRLLRCPGALQVVDVFDDVLVDRFPLDHEPEALALSGRFLYLAWHKSDTLAWDRPDGGGLIVFDVCDATTLREVGRFSSGWTYALAAREPFLYVGTSSGLIIMDVSQPDAPQEVGRYQEGNGYPWQVRVDGNMVYMLWTVDCVPSTSPAPCDASLRMLDVSAPTAVKEVATINLPGGTYLPHGSENIALLGRYLYVPLGRQRWAVYRRPQPGQGAAE